MADSQDFNAFNKTLSVLCWNMNGVKEKFKNAEVQSVFADHDIYW